MDTMGTVYTGLGLYEPAARLLRQAYAGRSRVLGGDHPDVARSLNQLGEVLTLQANYPEAEKYLQAALNDRRRVHGPDSLEVAETQMALAEVMSETGRYAEGEPLIRDALRDPPRAFRAPAPGRRGEHRGARHQLLRARRLRPGGAEPQAGAVDATRNAPRGPSVAGARDGQSRLGADGPGEVRRGGATAAGVARAEAPPLRRVAPHHRHRPEQPRLHAAVARRLRRSGARLHRGAGHEPQAARRRPPGGRAQREQPRLAAVSPRRPRGRRRAAAPRARVVPAARWARITRTSRASAPASRTGSSTSDSTRKRASCCRKASPSASRRSARSIRRWPAR